MLLKSLGFFVLGFATVSAAPVIIGGYSSQSDKPGSPGFPQLYSSPASETPHNIPGTRTFLRRRIFDNHSGAMQPQKRGPDQTRRLGRRSVPFPTARSSSEERPFCSSGNTQNGAPGFSQQITSPSSGTKTPPKDSTPAPVSSSENGSVPQFTA